QQGAEGGDLVELGIIFDDLLGVEPSTRREFQIADNGRPVAWSGGESKGGNRVEGFENNALARNQRAAEGVVEEMFLYQIPGKKIDGLVLAGFDKKALGYAVLDFVGVGKRGVAVEADKVGEIVDAGDVAIGGKGFDSVFVAVPRVG